MRRASLPCVLAALALYGMPAHAQGSAENRAAADALYEEGGTLMKAGRFTEACPKLETSQRLDPGVGTLLRLGFCYEHVGRTASAWSAYNDAEAMARRLNDKRANDAVTRAKALEPKLSKLVVSVAAPIAGLEVRRDGTVLDPGLIGTPTPVDPGEHVVEAGAPGKLPWRGSVRVDASATTATVAIPPLLPAPEAPHPGAMPFWSGRRIAGVVLGSAGIAGLVAGAGLGAAALSKNSYSKQNCSPMDPDFCNATGASVRSDAITLGNGSTAALVVGGAFALTGIVLFATAPSSKKPEAASLELLPGVGALSLRGSF